MFKKKTVEQQMKEQDRQLRRAQRDIGRDRGQLEKEEKKLEMEIKKAAKAGNKDTCAILAKQLVNLRKQKTRTYKASSTITSVGVQTKAMHSNMKMAKVMGTTAKTMGQVNKQMDPQKIAQTMQQFERENAKMEMSEEMINDTLDDVLNESGDEEEQDSIINQVLGEIGIDISGQMNNVNVPSNNLKESGSSAEFDDIEARLNALQTPGQ
uniref:Charged multivesicular body protein 2b-A n=1 Tax=Phallusia mammillata TaxID=59560 RepID=A0A6F9D938_9ASCI|nr:charged multivesicular body protein 2b-A [Phallusia mammillata]